MADLPPGLVVDNEALHGERIKLWEDFNRCWLSALQRQKEMTHDVLETGQPLAPPQSLIQEDFLERMGTRLVALCDDMEKHGLVDYQMGVWEEEIIICEHAPLSMPTRLTELVLRECLDLLEGGKDDSHGSEPKTRLGPSGSISGASGGGGGSSSGAVADSQPT